MLRQVGPVRYSVGVLLLLAALTALMTQVGSSAEATGLRLVTDLRADTMTVELSWEPAEPGSSPVVRYLYELLAGPAAGDLAMVSRDSLDASEPRRTSWTADTPPPGSCTYVQGRVIARDARGLLSRDGWGSTRILELCRPDLGPTTPSPSIDTVSVHHPLPDSIETVPLTVDLRVGEEHTFCAYRWDGARRGPARTARWAVGDLSLGTMGPPSAPDSAHCMRIRALRVPEVDLDGSPEAVAASWRTWVRTAAGDWPAFVAAWEQGLTPPRPTGP